MLACWTVRQRRETASVVSQTGPSTLASLNGLSGNYVSESQQARLWRPSQRVDRWPRSVEYLAPTLRFSPEGCGRHEGSRQRPKGRSFSSPADACWATVWPPPLLAVKKSPRYDPIAMHRSVASLVNALDADQLKELTEAVGLRRFEDVAAAEDPYALLLSRLRCARRAPDGRKALGILFPQESRKAPIFSFPVRMRVHSYAQGEPLTVEQTQVMVRRASSEQELVFQACRTALEQSLLGHLAVVKPPSADVVQRFSADGTTEVVFPTIDVGLGRHLFEISVSFSLGNERRHPSIAFRFLLAASSSENASMDAPMVSVLFAESEVIAQASLPHLSECYSEALGATLGREVRVRHERSVSIASTGSSDKRLVQVFDAIDFGRWSNPGVISEVLSSSAIREFLKLGADEIDSESQERAWRLITGFHGRSLYRLGRSAGPIPTVKAWGLSSTAKGSDAHEQASLASLDLVATEAFKLV
jgi:hypothetical protein